MALSWLRDCQNRRLNLVVPCDQFCDGPRLPFHHIHTRKEAAVVCIVFGIAAISLTSKKLGLPYVVGFARIDLEPCDVLEFC